eukprot:TRINITY_DN382_c0_g1_i2.p1 TRINITY_DN382_c0_g1~~TRINITY_DN382_c0_g1_i2.p1  ORF type:complete len:509 (-),score=124.52 TRINITY_DN382_c0_g1_i2:66-1592(-)
MKVIIFLLCCLLASASALQVQSGDALGCSICQFLADEIIEYNNQNYSMTDILSELNGDCKALMNPSWVSSCQQMVTDDAQTMIPYLKSSDATGACQHFGLCPAPQHSSLKVAPKEEEPIKGEIECGVCTFIASKVEEYLEENKTESEIEAQLNKDCRIFSKKTWIATCDGLVDEFAPEIIELAENKYPADVICQDIKFCNISTKAVVAPVITAVGGAECSVCEWLCSVGEKYIEENKTESEIVSAMADACDVLIDQSWIADCKSIVDENGDNIVQWLLDEESPETICARIGACSSSKQEEEVVVAAPKKVEASDLECSVCTFLTNLGERWVEENKTESQITQDLADSCDILIRDDWKEECKSLVEQEGPLIVQYLLNKEDPQVICQQIGACTSNKKSLPPPPPATEESTKCSVCEWLCTLGEHWVEENKTETEIVKAMSTACDVLIAKSWIEECDDLIEEDGDVVIQLLINKESPEKICADIDACTNSTIAHPPSRIASVFTQLFKQN